MKNFSYYALSFKGRRSNNEDACLAITIGDDCHFLAVADGMGGVAAGQTASRLVLKTAKSYLEKIVSEKNDTLNLKDILKRIYLDGQRVIATASARNPQLSGMGTTLACVLICGNRYVAGNLGDSRVYLLQKGILHQITEDHTYIQDYFKKTHQKPDEKILAQYSHYLLKSMDGGSDEPDIFPIEKPYAVIQPGEGFLLCSDGLITDKTETNTQIFSGYFVGAKSLKTSAENLISHAFYAGSTDNITVLLAEFGKIKRRKLKLKNYKYPPEVPKQAATKIKRQIQRYTVTFILLFALLAAALWGWKTGVFTGLFKQKDSAAKLNNSGSIKTTEPRFIDRVRFLTIEAPDVPLSPESALSWIPAKVENDKISYYKVIIYDRNNNIVDITKTESSPVYISNFTNLKSSQEYKWKVCVFTSKGLSDSTEMRTIKLRRRDK